MDLSFLKDRVEHVMNGAVHLMNECYGEALACFTSAIKEDGKNSSAYLYRACCHIARKDYKAALEDLEQVEKLGHQLYEAFLKKGVAYFYLEDYNQSHEFLLKSVAISQTQEQRENVDRWMSKLKAEAKITLATPTNSSASTITFKQTWTQDNKFINLSLIASTTIDPNNLTVNIERKNLSLVYNGSQVYTMEFSNGVNVSASSFERSNEGVRLKLKKEYDDFNWVNVDKAKEADSMDAQQKYPSSSKKKKDWDQVGKEIDDLLKKEPDDEGMNALFKEIYARGDENTRRAMIKSFQTSGGTVLSTNWGEVKEKDYEGKDRPEAPKGQEWKKHDA